MRRLAVAIALLVVAGAVWLLLRPRAEDARPDDAKPDEAAGIASPRDASAAPRALEAGRAPSRPRDAAGAESAGSPPRASAMSVHGRITTKAGAPAAGATVDVLVARGRFVEPAQTTTD